MQNLRRAYPERAAPALASQCRLTSITLGNGLIDFAGPIRLGAFTGALCAIVAGQKSEEDPP